MKTLSQTFAFYLYFKSVSTIKKIIFILIGSVLMAFTPSTNMQKVIDNATWQTTQSVTYDGSYYQLDYPNGDVPASIGVCTDVIVRAYRAINVDLQKLVHEDMLANKSEYDKRRYSKQVDANIDHRRTPNLQTFFTRQGTAVAVTKNGADYLPGDIVFWDLAAGHVGIVVDKKVSGTDRYQIVHNICCGPKMEDFLFSATIVGHYRWNP
jgi:uncharacterized protein YijF (DUF1287 family)